jgi:hypothetical protein
MLIYFEKSEQARFESGRRPQINAFVINYVTSSGVRATALAGMSALTNPVRRNLVCRYRGLRAERCKRRTRLICPMNRCSPHPMVSSSAVLDALFRRDALDA